MRNIVLATDEVLYRQLKRIEGYRRAGVGRWSDAQSEAEIRRELVRRQLDKQEARRKPLAR
jgi:hypothetical protein